MLNNTVNTNNKEFEPLTAQINSTQPLLEKVEKCIKTAIEADKNYQAEGGTDFFDTQNYYVELPVSVETLAFIKCLNDLNNLADALYNALDIYYGKFKADEVINEFFELKTPIHDLMQKHLINCINSKIGCLDFDTTCKI